MEGLTDYSLLLQINYAVVGSDSPKTLDLTADRTEHVFSLLLATHYYFTIAATNAHGKGPFSQQSVITTNSTS